jgi:hypothetical protein
MGGENGRGVFMVLKWKRRKLGRSLSLCLELRIVQGQEAPGKIQVELIFPYIKKVELIFSHQLEIY